MNPYRLAVPLLLILCQCSSGQWEPVPAEPSDSYKGQQWYGNGAGLVWSPTAMQRYEQSAHHYFLQQFGGGIQAVIPPVDDPNGNLQQTLGVTEQAVILRPLGTKIVPQPEDNTLVLQVAFDAVHWVASVPELPDCFATIQVQPFSVQMVFEPGRDVTGNITLSMVADPTHVTDVASQVQMSTCSTNRATMWVPWVNAAFETAVHQAVTSAPVASGFEKILSRFFGLGLVSRFRTDSQEYPVDSGWLDVLFESMSADGTEPTMVVAEDRLVLPLATTLTWTPGDCGLAPSGPMDAPSSTPILSLDDEQMDTDGVLILRKDFIEHWVLALGQAGMWCRSRGFDASSGIALHQVKALIGSVDEGILDSSSPLAIRARILDNPVVTWVAENDDEVILDLAFSELSVSFYVRLWNTDWLLATQTWSVQIKGATIGVSSTGSPALRLQGGTLHVDSDHGVVDPSTAELVFSALSSDWMVMPLPNILSMPIEPVRLSQKQGYLRMHFNLMESPVWESKSEVTSAAIAPRSSSAGPVGCASSSYTARNVPTAFLIGFCLFLLVCLRQWAPRYRKLNWAQMMCTSLLARVLGSSR